MPFTSESARHAFHRKAGLAAAKVGRADGFTSLIKARQVYRAMRELAERERERATLMMLAHKYNYHCSCCSAQSYHHCNETLATSLHCIHCNER